jgi:hypothetical protein
VDLEFLSFKISVVTILSVNGTLVAYVFVPSVFGANIPTAEFEMISAETALGHRKKIAKFLMRTFTCRSIPSSMLLPLDPVFLAEQGIPPGLVWWGESCLNRNIK